MQGEERMQRVRVRLTLKTDVGGLVFSSPAGACSPKSRKEVRGANGKRSQVRER